MESRFSKLSIKEDTGQTPSLISDQNGAASGENHFQSIHPDQTTQSRKLYLNECVSNFANVSNSTPPQLEDIVPEDNMRLNAASNITSMNEKTGIDTSNGETQTSNIASPQMLHIRKLYQRNAAKAIALKSHVDEVVESLSGLYKSYCSICLLDMTARDAYCCYEKGQDIRTALRNIYNMKKNVTDSNRDEFSKEFKKIQRMILKESKKILDTIPDNFAISNSSPSLLEVVPPRILIEPRVRIETNFGMQLNAAPISGKQNAKINELQITPQGSSEVSNFASMPTACIYVSNLKKKEIEKLIFSLYEEFGRIFKPELFLDSDPYAFIKFFRDSDAKTAFLFMNKKMYLDMNIQVSWAKMEIDSVGNSYFCMDVVDQSNELQITPQDSFDVCNYETKKLKTMPSKDYKVEAI